MYLTLLTNKKWNICFWNEVCSEYLKKARIISSEVLKREEFSFVS